jgi:hypothetical protein
VKFDIIRVSWGEIMRSNGEKLKLY